MVKTKNIRIEYFVLLVILLTSCSSNKYLLDKEKELGTTGKYNWSFHRLSDRDKGVTLAFPGYIIGLEKSRRKYIGAPSCKALKNDSILKKYGFNDTTAGWKDMPLYKRMILNDGKTSFVSSIFEYKLNKNIVPYIEQHTIYNAYETKYLSQPNKAFNKGYNELELLGDKILNDIKTNNITHVFLFSMGWNTDQQEALRNFNSLYLNILKNGEKSAKEFRPFFVGFTWSSKWNDGISNVFSLFNKSNDADEIGMLWFNLLLNKKILNDSNQVNNFKTVLIGHSLGAKLTSRATMSASMLANKSRPVDLLINLESAYSINRFSQKKGIEDTFDYQEWQSYANNIALVWSEHDTAMKTAIWAPYAGGKKGHRRVKNHPGCYPGIERVYLTENPNIGFTNPKQLLLIDASSIIYRDAHFKGGAAHSDIYNTEVSNMIWNLIETSTF